MKRIFNFLLDTALALLVKLVAIVLIKERIIFIKKANHMRWKVWFGFKLRLSDPVLDPTFVVYKDYFFYKDAQNYLKRLRKFRWIDFIDEYNNYGHTKKNLKDI